MNAFRNVYKVWAGQKVVAFITGRNEKEVVKKYGDNGGKHDNISVTQESFGWHEDVCSVYE